MDMIEFFRTRVHFEAWLVEQHTLQIPLNVLFSNIIKFLVNLQNKNNQKDRKIDFKEKLCLFSK